MKRPNLLLAVILASNSAHAAYNAPVPCEAVRAAENRYLLALGSGIALYCMILVAKRLKPIKQLDSIHWDTLLYRYLPVFGTFVISFYGIRESSNPLNLTFEVDCFSPWIRFLEQMFKWSILVAALFFAAFPRSKGDLQ